MTTNTAIPSGPELLLTRSQVAAMLGVSPTTVTRWAREGRLPCRLTLGGHHRYSRGVIEAISTRMTTKGAVTAFPAAKPVLEVRQ
jgi:excisionase family DNA binding protein